MSKRSGPGGLGSLATAAITAIALAVQAGLAAVVGVIIAREFGRTAETDGFFAAYGVFIVLALAATAMRLVVLPALARARQDNRLGSETASWAIALATIAIPLVVVTIVAARPLGALLTGFGPTESRDAATDVLPLMVVAAMAQLYAGLGASALAALDDYVTAAISYIAASCVGLGWILLRIDDDGIRAVATGMLLNGLVASVLPALALAFRARGAAMPPSGLRPAPATLRGRLFDAARGISLPLALQAVYLICLPFAAREGVGAVTSFGYAFLAGSAVVAVAASSLGLVTSVPLARTGVDADRVVRHVIGSSWIAIVAVGATAGVFVLAGEPIMATVLGRGYDDRVGAELGRLVASLSPWMVASIGFSVTLPVMFVAGRVGRLPAISGLVLLVHVPLAWLGQQLAGLSGLAVALAVSTTVALVGQLSALNAARATLIGLLRASVVTAAAAIVAFGLAQVLLDALPAAALGLAGYAGLLAIVRPSGLRASWSYLRHL